jgi:hypothetical protein
LIFYCPWNKGSTVEAKAEAMDIRAGMMFCTKRVSARWHQMRQRKAPALMSLSCWRLSNILNKSVQCAHTQPAHIADDAHEVDENDGAEKEDLVDRAEPAARIIQAQDIRASEL